MEEDGAPEKMSNGVELEEMGDVEGQNDREPQRCTFGRSCPCFDMLGANDQLRSS
jgi:hypothetical protein